MLSLLLLIAAAPHIQLSVDKDAQACLIHLHGDESAARHAMLTLGRTHKVNTLHFTSDKAGKKPLTTRAIRISDQCAPDPNRIFTEAGRKQQCTSTALGKWVTDALMPALLKCRADNLPVIAFHNNAAFTLATFDDVTKEKNQAALKPGNIFLVTRKDDFDALKAANKRDVVLQVAEPGDDGSLSVALASERYFNVETRRDPPGISVEMGREVLQLVGVQMR